MIAQKETVAMAIEATESAEYHSRADGNKGAGNESRFMWKYHKKQNLETLNLIAKAYENVDR